MGMQKKPTVKVRLMHRKFTDTQFEPGHSGNPAGKPKGTTLYRVIQKTLDERSVSGHGSRRDKVADAFVQAAEGGSFIHAKEILDREEGKTPARLANADGSNLKMYDNMPIDGEDSP